MYDGCIDSSWCYICAATHTLHVHHVVWMCSALPEYFIAWLCRTKLFSEWVEILVRMLKIICIPRKCEQKLYIPKVFSFFNDLAALTSTSVRVLFCLTSLLCIVTAYVSFNNSLYNCYHMIKPVCITAATWSNQSCVTVATWSKQESVVSATTVDAQKSSNQSVYTATKCWKTSTNFFVGNFSGNFPESGNIGSIELFCL